MDTAKVSLLGGGDRLGLREEDPMVYVHQSAVEYRATRTASQSEFSILDMRCSTYLPLFLA
jgi:hypothetical protein